MLQQRAPSKRLWPLFWSSSCRSHPRRTETMEAQFDASHAEHEFCSVFVGRCSAPLRINRREIFAWRWITPQALQAEVSGVRAERFTPWFAILSIPLIQAYRVGRQSMSVEAALRAVDECGAPMVSIPGGEPLIHNDMAQIAAGIVVRRKFVYVCTNARLLAKHIDEYRPSPYLTFSIHLDGGRKRHDEPFARKAYSTRRLRPYDWHAARAFE